MLKQNEGTIDRTIRLIVGILAFFIGYMYLIGTPQIVAYVIGVIGIVTAAIGYCGLYALLHISTRAK